MILDSPSLHMYNVHMKHVTASEARKNWFRLLDEAAGGETIVIQRRGHRLVLREEPSDETSEPVAPDYSALLAAPRVDRADTWSWTWTGEGEPLLLRDGDGVEGGER